MKTLIENTMVQVLEAGILEIRDIDAGEDPFLYASGNWGPGYISIKNLVTYGELLRTLPLLLAIRIVVICPYIEVVAGNVTGGMIPGWLLSEYLGILLSKQIPFCYVRETRKKGGQKERITGFNISTAINPNVLVVEELVNFAQTTCNSAKALRQGSFLVTHAACILTFDNPVANIQLTETAIQLISLFSLEDLLLVADKYSTHSDKLIKIFREFRKNPLRWQQERKLKPVEGGGTQ